MSTTTNTTNPLPVQIRALLDQHYGQPQRGGQESELSLAIGKLIAVAAQQRAMRQLWRAEEGVWDKLKTELNTPQKGAH